MPTPRAALLLALSLATPSGARAADRMQPGLWEVTATVELPGLPAPPPTTQTECLTQRDVDAGPVPEVARGGCTASDVRRSGDRISWKLDCGQLGKGEGELTTRSGTSYDGWMKLVTGGTTVKTVIRARRVGGC